MLTLKVLPPTLAVCRLSPDSAIPDWASAGTFYSVNRTVDELSIVCEQSLVPSNTKSEKNWRALKVEGTLDFALTGILASIANPLAAAKISIFAISTFDTDYVLIRASDLERACSALKEAAFSVR
jgi:hypothetical protein